MRRIPSAVLFPALVLLAAAAVGGSLLVGSTKFSRLTAEVVLDVRLGRAVLAFLAGASLALSGAVFQALFRNPLADPFVVGVSGGAGLGAVSATLLGLTGTIAGMGISTAAAFAGGLGGALLAWRLATVHGRVPVASLLLAGSAIGAFSSATVSTTLLLTGRNWSEVMAWLLGFVDDSAPWDRAAMLAPCLLAAAVVVALHARDLDLLLLGDEQARQLGSDAERAKGRLLAAGSIAAAGAVAACGIIGFVGLIVPHVLRTLGGPRHRVLLPTVVLGGGILLVLADVVARLVAPGTPLPVGSVTALAGAPFFVYLLRRRADRA
jgi:iron complex transport system permease protein